MVTSIPHVNIRPVQQIKKKSWFKQLFCKHDYKKTGWDECYDEKRNERYTIRYYTCQKCGKRIVVDGRYDPYARL